MVKKHLHIYERSKTNKEVYRCISPDCTHFTQRELILGKAIICAKCGAQTLALQMQLRAGQQRAGRKQLTCLSCSASPKGAEVKEIQQTITDFLEGINDGLNKAS